MGKPMIVFKCEDSMWQMLAEEGVTGLRGRRFDPRRYDTGDERIYRLAWGLLSDTGAAHVRSSPHWVPDEKSITFWNLDTHELLELEYLGMEFADWAPGWCFLILGKTIGRIQADV